jgi:hypothetical protein
MARSKSRLSLAPLTIAVVATATPATLALSLYMITKNPSLRPLAQTRETNWLLPGERKPLLVVIFWPSAQNPAQAEAMAGHVRQTIKAKGIYAKVAIVDTDGPSRIVYHVGANIIGPFPLASAIDGIPGAVDAYWRQPGAARSEGM